MILNFRHCKHTIDKPYYLLKINFSGIADRIRVPGICQIISDNLKKMLFKLHLYVLWTAI